MHLLLVGLSELEMHLYIISVMDVLCCESAVVGQHCAGHKGKALGDCVDHSGYKGQLRC